MTMHTLKTDDIVVRLAEPSDAEGIVQLFLEDGTNAYEWSIQKWWHYYVDYPDGQPIALIAEIDKKTVGHYGMVPVVIGKWHAMLGLHAYVSKDYRGLSIISTVMAGVDAVCKDRGVALVCGFANPNFSLIKKTFFKWHIPLWLGFKKGISAADAVRGDATFFFEYSEDWYSWRFGVARDCYLSRFVDGEGNIHKQVLKMRGRTLEKEQLCNAECWSRSTMYATAQRKQFCQPYSVKIYDRSLINLGILRPENWFIEMGDSDTFKYIPWSES